MNAVIFQKHCTVVTKKGGEPKPITYYTKVVVDGQSFGPDEIRSRAMDALWDRNSDPNAESRVWISPADVDVALEVLYGKDVNIEYKDEV